MIKMMQAVKSWYRLKEQKQNNRGATLVLVIAAMGLIGILVAVILSMSLMNFQMKQTNLKSQKVFYTAETALDEIRTGLVQNVSDASAIAYTDTMVKYNALTKEERMEQFQSEFVTQLRNVTGMTAGEATTATYSVDYLEGLLKTTAYDASTNVGAVISSPQNALNVTTNGLILKNVVVTYYGEQSYMTQLKTDIVLNYPDIDFSQESNVPDLLHYALVANDSLEITAGANSTISGNAYIGKNGALISNSNVTFDSDSAIGEQNLLVTKSAINVNQGSTLTITGRETWADSILVDSSSAQIDGTTYLSNDLVIDNTIWNEGSLTKPSVSAKLSGSLYAYGNVESAVNADSLADSIASVQENPAAYSSAVIINGINATVDLHQLTSMVIAGNAYVASSSQTGGIDGSNADDVEMGESISIKSNQTAYLVPAECVAPDSAYGGENPMTQATYEALINDIGGTAELVSYNTMTSDYNMTLSGLGVNNYQLESFPVAKLGSMVYLFMKFDTQAQAVSFFNNYYADAAKLSKLTNKLDLYTDSILLPSSLLVPDEEEEHQFYYNGNIVMNDDSADKFMTSSMFDTTMTNEDYADLLAQEAQYRDNYVSLNTKMIKRYYQLSDAEKTKDVYNNLVKSFTNADPALNIAAGATKTFFSNDPTDVLGCVVANGNYTIDSDVITGNNAEGVEVDGKLCVVIANGDVTVNTDFNGLIIASGKILISAKNVTIAPDAMSSTIALKAVNEQGVSASDYLIDADKYVVGGITAASGDSNHISMTDLVTYENWSKQ